MPGNEPTRGKTQERLGSHCRDPLDLDQCFKNVQVRLSKGDRSWYTPIPTGFSWLDKYLGGGWHAPDFCLWGGVQGIGKTTTLLQSAVAIAKNPSPRAFPIFICFEHPEIDLFQRILCLQSAFTADRTGEQPFTILQLEEAYNRTVDLIQSHPDKAVPTLDTLFSFLPSSAHSALSDISAYWHNMWLVMGIPNYTHTGAIRKYVEMCTARYHLPVVLFIDYVQRVPVPPMPGVSLSVMQHIDYVIRELDSIAKDFMIPVVGIAAADEESLRVGRVHLENMFGSNALQYDPAVAVILNWDIDGRVRMSLEKNRRGPGD